MQEFLTISQLAHGFNVSEKVIRHAFKKLLKEGKLTEGEDYIREGYIDDLHFVYKIHPGKFAAHTKLFPAPSSVKPLSTTPENGTTTFDSKADALASQDGDHGSQSGSQRDEFGSNIGTTGAAMHDDTETTFSLVGTRQHEKPDYLDEFIASKNEEINILKDHVEELDPNLRRKMSKFRTKTICLMHRAKIKTMRGN